MLMNYILRFALLILFIVYFISAHECSKSLSLLSSLSVSVSVSVSLSRLVSGMTKIAALLKEFQLKISRRSLDYIK